MALDYYHHYSTRRRQNILVLLVQPSWELRLVDVSPIHNFESTNYRIVDMSPIHDFYPTMPCESPLLTDYDVCSHGITQCVNASLLEGERPFDLLICLLLALVSIWIRYTGSSRNVKTLMVQDFIARIRVSSKDLKMASYQSLSLQLKTLSLYLLEIKWATCTYIQSL